MEKFSVFFCYSSKNSFVTLCSARIAYTITYCAFCITYMTYLYDLPTCVEVGNVGVQRHKSEQPLYSDNTHHRWEVSLYGWPPVYFVCIQLLCSCCINNSFTCLSKSKPVKQEVSGTVIIPPMVSVLCFILPNYLYHLIPLYLSLKYTRQK